MAGPTPSHTDVTDVQLGLHESYSKSCCLYVGYVLLAGLPCLASVGEEVASLTET